jgi:hypothetical protein
MENEQSRKNADLEEEQKLAQAMENLKHQELVDMKNKYINILFVLIYYSNLLLIFKIL